MPTTYNYNVSARIYAMLTKEEKEAFEKYLEEIGAVITITE